MTARRRVIREDVARMAGTSTAVVSYVVNDGPRPVSAATRQRVLDAIERTGYRPDAVARTLAAGTSRTYGLLVPDISNRFFAELVHEIEVLAYRTGRQILLGDCAEDPARERDLLTSFLARRVDAILLASVGANPDLREAVDAGVPIVLIDRTAVGDLSSVTVDNMGGARAAVRHLVDHGHHAIACIAGPRDLPTSRDREEGWAAALNDAGLSYRLRVEAPFSRAGGYAAGREMLTSQRGPTAIFASNEQQAIGVLRVAHESGLNVPVDVAVMTFDGSEDAAYSVPSLSTVIQPLAQIARHAVRLLDGSQGTERIITPYSLALRASCGCPDQLVSPWPSAIEPEPPVPTQVEKHQQASR